MKKLTVVPTRLDEANKTYPACVSCGRYSAPKLPFIPKGWTREYLIVLPSWKDGEGTKPWYATLSELRRLVRAAQLNDNQVAYVCALRCGTDAMTAASGKACAPFLEIVVRRLSPAYTLLLGDAYRSYRKNWSPYNVNDVLGINVAAYGEQAAYVYYSPDNPLFTPGGLQHELARFTSPVLTPLPPTKELTPSVAPLGVDTEFTSDTVYTVACARVNSKEYAVSDLSSPNPAVYEAIRNAQTIVGHNVWVDLDQLVKLKLCKEQWLAGVDVLDTYLCARMVDENLGSGAYGVEALVRRFYRVEQWKDKTDEIDPTQPGSWPAELRIERCGLDAWATTRLYETLVPHIHGPLTFTHQIAATLHRLRYIGVAIDTTALWELKSNLETARSIAQHKLAACAAQYGFARFEPTNDTQVRELLYTKIGLQPLGSTPSGKPSVAKDALIPYASHPVVSLLTEYNEADRSLTVLTGEKGILQNMRVRDERTAILPVNIWPLQAKTARRASTSPNMQNWKQDMRKLVRSRWEGGVILDVDYKSLEPRILGVIANDARYLEYFLDGRGYLGIAADVLKRKVEKGTPEYRTVKEVVLGTNYGAGPKKIGTKLWNELDTKLAPTFEKHVLEVRKLQDRYLTVFYGIQRYMETQERTLLKHQAVVTATGRIRHLPCPYGKDTSGYKHLLNMAYNYPIQSLASDITGGALVDVENLLLQTAGLTRVEFCDRILNTMSNASAEYPRVPLIVNEIHDELVFDIPPSGNVQEWVDMILWAMKSCKSFSEVSNVKVPVDVEYVTAPTWGIK